MDNAIREIIDGIKSGLYFDSHFVINQLIRNHSDAYLRYAQEFKADVSDITLVMHGQIGLKIGRLTDKVEKVGDSLSENIHTNIGECACWRKL